MKMIKTLTAITLSAALVPAMVLSSAAVAEERRGMQGEQQRSGEVYLSGTPTGALYADDIIGANVMHRGSDENIGEIQDLVIGRDGKIVGVVIKTGGFMGLGGQDVALNWDRLEHALEDDDSVFYVDMDENALRNAPEHQRD